MPRHFHVALTLHLKGGFLEDRPQTALIEFMCDPNADEVRTITLYVSPSSPNVPSPSHRAQHSLEKAMAFIPSSGVQNMAAVTLPPRPNHI